MVKKAAPPVDRILHGLTAMRRPLGEAGLSQAIRDIEAVAAIVKAAGDEQPECAELAELARRMVPRLQAAVRPGADVAAALGLRPGRGKYNRHPERAAIRNLLRVDFRALADVSGEQAIRPAAKAVAEMIERRDPRTDHLFTLVARLSRPPKLTYTAIEAALRQHAEPA